MNSVDCSLWAHERWHGAWQCQLSIRHGWAAGHAEVAAAITLTNHDGNARDFCLADCMQQFGAMPDDAGFFYSTADHVAADILQEKERNVECVAGPDKAGCFVGAVVKKHTAFVLRVVCDDPYWSAAQVGKCGVDLFGKQGFHFEDRAFVNE
ncbi:hypothetical protein D3C76_1016260 [compost metagenome]